jgi:hypothetical protein
VRPLGVALPVAAPWALDPDAARRAAVEIFPEALIPGVAVRQVAAVQGLRPDACLAGRRGHLDDSATVGRVAMAVAGLAQLVPFRAVQVLFPVAEGPFGDVELAGRTEARLIPAQLLQVAAEPAMSGGLDALAQLRQAELRELQALAL